jgi:predicted  nucleic acid-binding Zn-ribbon protein
MSSAKQLYDLQEVDQVIDENREALEHTRSRLDRGDELAPQRESLESARKRLAELEHQQRQAEWGVEDLSTKFTQEEKKLYDGSVKNPRELMGLQQETELIKQHRREEEDKLLSIMLEADAAREELASLERGLETKEEAWDREQQELQARSAKLESVLSCLEQQRKAMAQQIDPASMRLYEHLRVAKQGKAVARVEQGMCRGCRISLPMSDQQKARIGQELATCSNCGRILCAG